MSTRIVQVSGTISAMDHETFGSNERESAPVSGEAVVSTEGFPSELVKMSLGVGGEVRVDLDLNVSVRPNDVVRIEGSAKLFEGDDENTQDLEDEEAIQIQVLPGTPRSYKAGLANTGFGGGDKADIVLTFTNEEANVGLTSGGLASGFRVSLWKVDDQGEHISFKEHGPFAGWTALNYADGRILWRHTDNHISLWKVDDQGELISFKEHGPFEGWVPLSYDDGKILWCHADNHISL
ncbi:hypothetical protein H6F93_10965 [Leptolyngbya sp. FACHB-671]|uniref:hypothetical protein n=1 Tax=Leptolyngbya sp. FACHB-671 TaxID=2692812 RepID=UPI0016839C83|nr:hypothetical protein [Leptolyngbya sp. FACHB-671]MBD2068038.1 hypothetical protein [Leptolyngbya sp. FACHB-671]